MNTHKETNTQRWDELNASQTTRLELRGEADSSADGFIHKGEWRGCHLQSHMTGRPLQPLSVWAVAASTPSPLTGSHFVRYISCAALLPPAVIIKPIRWWQSRAIRAGRFRHYLFIPHIHVFLFFLLFFLELWWRPSGPGAGFNLTSICVKTRPAAGARRYRTLSSEPKIPGATFEMKPPQMICYFLLQRGCYWSSSLLLFICLSHRAALLSHECRCIENRLWRRHTLAYG